MVLYGIELHTIWLHCLCYYEVINVKNVTSLVLQMSMYMLSKCGKLFKTPNSFYIESNLFSEKNLNHIVGDLEGCLSWMLLGIL